MKKKGRNVVMPWLLAHSEHEDDECLIWPFTFSGNGYGWVRSDGKSMNASRVMCILAHGKPPTPKHQALHSCDNKQCVNPQHLSWGTSSQNNSEAYERNIHGNRTRLSVEQLAEIRRLRGQVSQREIGIRFGLSQTYVSTIIRNPDRGKTARRAG